MPIKQRAISEVVAVQKIHERVSSFGAFLQNIRDNSAGNVAAAIQIPGRVTGLLADKASFDAFGISNARVAEIMEKNLAYTDFSLVSADFQAVFTKAPQLRTVVLNNINALTPSFNGDTLQWAAGAAQTALENQLDDILQHYE